MTAIQISNGIITEISTNRDNTLATVNYRNTSENRRNLQTVQLLINDRTIILNQNGELLPSSSLMEGMTINASLSSAMTRSIPPQATAYIIQIITIPPQLNIVTGRILEVNRQTQSFTTISDREPFSIIRFNTSDDTGIFGPMGRPVPFSRLLPGMQVRVRHADFMTASIPPQTTAFEIQIL